jgi:hypothetical protein
MGQVEPKELERPVERMVRAMLDKGLVKNDVFAKGVLSIDGKSAVGEEGEAPCEKLRTARNARGQPYWYGFAARACLTSSLARPVLGQVAVGAGEGEASVFPGLFARMVKQHGQHFSVVTVDAGFTSTANARVVLEHGKHYLFALKDNHHDRYVRAHCRLMNEPVVASSSEFISGRRVKRELTVVSLSEDDGSFLPRARQLVMIRQFTTPRDKALPKAETRFFITSAPRSWLSPRKLLKLIRLHWGIENGPNQAADVILDEDTAAPCYKGNAPQVLSWLHVLAYNLLALVRSLQPLKDRRPESYRRSQEILYQALLGLRVLPRSLIHLA